MGDPAGPTPERVRVAADNLRIDAATAEVVRSFSAAGIRTIVLKGPSFARWLYPPDRPRGYTDSDLLVSPADNGRAESELVELGFRRRYDVGGLPQWWAEH